jgi:hypothetical protein
MRRYGDLSKDQEQLLPLHFCPDCITATRGYDFREGQAADAIKPSRATRESAYGLHSWTRPFLSRTEPELYSKTFTL